MTTQKYIARSVKYLVQLLVLLGLLFLLMALTGTSRVPADQLFAEIFLTTRGLVMLCAIVALAAFYPRFGYVNRTVAGDLAENRQQIIEAFHMGGYTLDREEPGRMVFRASSPVRRVWMMGEDPVTVTANDGQIVLNGHRKQVVTAEYRLRGLIQR